MVAALSLAQVDQMIEGVLGMLFTQTELLFFCISFSPTNNRSFVDLVNPVLEENIWHLK